MWVQVSSGNLIYSGGIGAYMLQSYVGVLISNLTLPV